MTARRSAFFLFGALAFWLGSAASFADEAVPRAFGFDHLSDNGRNFITSEASLPLRCLDLPGLLALPEKDQDLVLDKAGSAGFNAISFEAPLYGPQGLAQTLGQVDAARSGALVRLLAAMAKHRLYAFPVLWTPAAADALIGTVNAKTAFFNGKNSLGWEAWAARNLAALKLDQGEPITATAAVGGWLLYRGPWPGGEPKQGAAPEAVTPSSEAWMRNWARWQVQVFHKAGFTQRLGLGLWAKRDLGAADDASLAAPAPAVDLQRLANTEAEEGAPFAPLSGGADDSAGNTPPTQAPDILPAVPGKAGVAAMEGASATAAAATPWDLEGLDWDRVEAFLANAPLNTQVDFLEFSLDTEDWYRVGDRLAEAAAKAEVPIVWRQDWRTASRYERGKRLEPPAPLAGLAGPWPDDDWPGDGESIWPSKEEHSGAVVPFQIRQVELARKGGKILLTAELNKPATLTVRWGKGWPLDHEWHSQGRPKTAQTLPLVGAAPGQWLLVQVRAQSLGGALAVARAHWLRAPK
jgi:hypothetical protein